MNRLDHERLTHELTPVASAQLGNLGPRHQLDRTLCAHRVACQVGLEETADRHFKLELALLLEIERFLGLLRRVRLDLPPRMLGALLEHVGRHEALDVDAAKRFGLRIMPAIRVRDIVDPEFEEDLDRHLLELRLDGNLFVARDHRIPFKHDNLVVLFKRVDVAHGPRRDVVHLERAAVGPEWFCRTRGALLLVPNLRLRLLGLCLGLGLLLLRLLRRLRRRHAPRATKHDRALVAFALALFLALRPDRGRLPIVARREDLDDVLRVRLRPHVLGL
mmetsp:Transcript_25405/g.59121  ORF Transcript_25405/g.59121 Transcript_25405/m.59121 type:complete len:276 (+) Transcript_25405:1113-1940(+)